MTQYRITKYDPQYRINGVYERVEWTSVSDVGSVFEDGVLTREECDRTIRHYADCALELLKAAGIQALTILALEDFDLQFPWYSWQRISLKKAAEVILACLEEKCWCMLAADQAFVHFGYDLYMYVGVDLPFGAVRDVCTRCGLFAEVFPSPYCEVDSEEKAPSPLVFSTEAQAPAADIIMDCLLTIERKHRIISLAPYTDALDSIGVIPWCMTDSFILEGMKDRTYISWKNRYADIRLRIDFDAIVHANKAERMRLCRENVLRSLAAVQERCRRKKLRFDLDALLADLFPENE